LTKLNTDDFGSIAERSQSPHQESGIMIELQHLTKTYGDKLAVDAISATIRPGVVTGFSFPTGPASRRRCG
jgi:hypothetical protein